MEIDRCDVESLIERSCRLQFERPLSREIPRDRLVKIFAYAEESSSERPRRCHRRVIRSNPHNIRSSRDAPTIRQRNSSRCGHRSNSHRCFSSRITFARSPIYIRSTKITKAIEDAARHYLYLYDSSPVDPSITNRMRMCFFFPLLFLFPFSFSSSFFSAKSWWNVGGMLLLRTLDRWLENKKGKRRKRRQRPGYEWKICLTVPKLVPSSHRPFGGSSLPYLSLSLSLSLLLPSQPVITKGNE